MRRREFIAGLSGAAVWPLVARAQQASRDGEFEYYIKHTSELHERIAKESELHKARR